MQIKRLRLAGFKSFVDPADLRIEPGLTGVVGPNGCGKSNLLEALRWAMGETSAQVDARRRHGGRDLRRHRDAPVARLRRSFDPDRARRPDRPRRDRGGPADRARRGLRLPDRRQGRAGQGRGVAVRRRRDRRAFACAGQPGAHWRGDRGQARRPPPDAGGSGRDCRAARPSQGRRTEIARDRGQSGPARRDHRRPGQSRRGAAAAGASRPSAIAHCPTGSGSPKRG